MRVILIKLLNLLIYILHWILMIKMWKYHRITFKIFIMCDVIFDKLSNFLVSFSRNILFLQEKLLPLIQFKVRHLETSKRVVFIIVHLSVNKLITYQLGSFWDLFFSSKGKTVKQTTNHQPNSTQYSFILAKVEASYSPALLAGCSTGLSNDTTHWVWFINERQLLRKLASIR